MRQDWYLRGIGSMVAFCALFGVSGTFPMLATVPAYAQGENARSEYAGIALPKGASRVLDKSLSAGMGKFLGVEAAKYLSIPPQSGNAEVFFWSGDNYRPGRLGFAKTMVQEALTEAGFTYRELSDTENTPNHFDEGYNLEALEFSPFQGRPVYFTATNDQKKVTIAGFWFNQEDKKRLILAIARAGFQASAKAADNTLPEVGPNAVLVKDLKNATKGLPAPKLPTFPSIAKKPRTARGMVKDASGKPIAGAKIIVQASAAGGFRTSVTGRTNANGVYEIPLPLGVCEVVNADCRINYQEQTYLVPLHPVDGQLEHFQSADGHIENFVLRVAGSTGGDSDSNYGGVIRVFNISGVESAAVVEITLTPNGPLMDGSQGKTFVFRFPNRNLNETYLGGIPVGRYTLKARLYESGDALPLRIQKTFGESTLSSSMVVEFESHDGEIASLRRSIVKQFDITLKP